MNVALPQAKVDHAASLLGSDPAAAEREARARLLTAPGDPRALLILASARRRLGDAHAALSMLAPLAQTYPRAALTQYELGAALADLGRHEEAIVALRRAVALRPDLADAWRRLGDQLFETGDNELADAAFAQAARSAITDPTLRPAAEALCAGNLERAEASLDVALADRPDEPSALQMLAQVCARRGDHAQAERLLARVLRLHPARDAARFDYAQALFQQQKGPQALEEVERLLTAEPSNAAYLNLAAACLGLVGDFERVEAIYTALLGRYPNQARIWLNHAHALRTIGRRDAAVAAYRRCIALAPALGDAYWGLANLKVTRFTPEEEAALGRLVERTGTAVEDRVNLHFALGKSLEDRNDAARAFVHYSRGAALRRSVTPYDAASTSEQALRTRRLFTREFFAAREEGGSPARAPIFVVGLPRSGSTLVEQILASHPRVEGTMELPDIGLIARGWDSGLYPGPLAELDPLARTGLGDGYVADTRVHRRLGREFFVDKMPNNFQHVGLIHLILPHAKIVDVRRHPMAACFSAFKQHFAQGQSFSYDLDDLGRYYRDYLDVMAHFESVLPGRVHCVVYEDLVQDTEREIRRLLDHCGLAFEPGCLRFHENDRAVRTVSSEQVRRPIFRDGLDHWRAFAAWLGPLERALGPALADWRGGSRTAPAA